MSGGSDWSTGLCSVWDDFETMLNATALCGSMLVCLPAKNNVELNGGQATCGLRGGPILRMTKDCGCQESDVAFAINLGIFALFPPVAIVWRKQVRDTFSIDGSIVGDLLACAGCFPCAVMQECREIKRRGTALLRVPAQLSMAAR